MKKRSGFTIIEVSLVLAIAGLILMMVFIALPALQRTTRDTQRREDMTKVITAIKTYQNNNRGSLPSASGWASFKSKYLDSLKDPSSGTDYALAPVDCGVSVANNPCTGAASYESVQFPNDYKITIVTGAICDGEQAKKANNPRRVAILYKLEVGTYCGEV